MSEAIQNFKKQKYEVVPISYPKVLIRKNKSKQHMPCIIKWTKFPFLCNLNCTPVKTPNNAQGSQGIKGKFTMVISSIGPGIIKKRTKIPQ